MDHIEDYQDRLLFAIPKKGRLHEKCIGLLNNVDIQFHRKPRHDIALVQNFPIALIFLPASDIAKYVGEGNVDLGITGQDIVAESEAEDKVNVIQKLGFGKCKLQVQTPVRNQIQTASMLIGQRIVTSFPVVTKKYFDELEKSNPNGAKTQIRFVGGSVETACALGLAQGIVDLVESGETMRAAGLEAIATILESEAVLISNFNTKHPDLVKRIQARIEGSLLANKYVICTYNSPRSMLQECIKITPGRKAPTLSPLEDKEWVAVSVMVEASKISDIMDQLTSIGASDIMVTKLVNCRA